ncbi:mannose-1-phosphate guanylyltransferase [Methylophaga sp. 42_8_T64]|mgnify:CR=1 FL=1|nr:mannose-1-phosphate guanylyltransferase [Methylophaga sp. 42_8_T64]
MKAMILSAGRGERLRPLTDHTPKPLLKAGKYRLIEYLIQSLVKAGFTEIVINTAHLGEQFPKTLGDGSQFDAKITYSPEQQGGLETAGGIINALALLGDEPFLIVNGDIWTDFPFEQLTNFTLSPDTFAHLVLVNNPEHNLQGDFALNLGRVNQTEQQRYTYSGIAIYHPKLFSGFKVHRLALKLVLLQAIEQQQISGQLYQGQWSDIGTVERLQQLNAQLET